MGMTIDNAISWLLSIAEHEGEDIPIYDTDVEAIKMGIDTMRKYQQLEDFTRWVATEVIDEEMWTYNHLAFAELACRKLVQLGIMQESNGEYLYEVVEDGNDDN